MVDQTYTLGIQTDAPVYEKKKKIFNVKHICKAYSSMIKKWCCVKKPSARSHSNSSEADAKPKFQDPLKEVGGACNADIRGGNGPANTDNLFSKAPFLSKTGSRRNPSPIPPFRSGNLGRSTSPTPSPSSLRRTASHHISGLRNDFSASLSRNASKGRSNPIMFSSSSGKIVKPPAIQKDLECTLEELCFGCTKNVNVTRAVLTHIGQIIQEEEILNVEVKPGWKKGTKVTFQGSERPGTFKSDVIFVVSEKQHSLFQREEDNLKIEIEIPLVQALTGGEISIPLLTGEKKSLKIDDIIYPGYEIIIDGEGMPKSSEEEKRGDLKVVFEVEFPTVLTDEQRSGVVSILKDSD